MYAFKTHSVSLYLNSDDSHEILHFSAVFLSYTSSLSCGNQLIGCCFCWWSYRNQPFLSCCVSCFTSINNHISCMESIWWKLGDISSLWALPFKQIYASQPGIPPGWARVWIIREALYWCKHRRVTIMGHGKVSTKSLWLFTSCPGGNMEDYWSGVTCLCWVHLQTSKPTNYITD